MCKFLCKTIIKFSSQGDEPNSPFCQFLDQILSKQYMYQIWLIHSALWSDFLIPNMYYNIFSMEAYHSWRIFSIEFALLTINTTISFEVKKICYQNINSNSQVSIVLNDLQFVLPRSNLCFYFTKRRVLQTNHFWLKQIFILLKMRLSDASKSIIEQKLIEVFCSAGTIWIQLEKFSSLKLNFC